MESAKKFRAKLQQGRVCLGAVVSFNDPTITEAMASVLDFVWIDAEHSPMSLETVQAHVMATNGSDATPLVRVPWNDPVLIKPVLDLGAAGVIVPLVRNADDVRRAVAACRYPPDGVRGFGPRRPSHYGRQGGPEFCKAENESIITIAQIEHADAVANLDEILAVPGLTGIVMGPNDLAGSMGHTGDPKHPEVVAAIELVLAKAMRAGVPGGMGFGGEVETLLGWIAKGARWTTIGADFQLLMRSVTQLATQVRERLPK